MKEVPKTALMTTYITLAGSGGNSSGLVNENWGSDKDSNPTWKSASTYKSSLEEERMNSYFGRLRYNFKEKYMLEATIRRDGSSVFRRRRALGYLPSVAAGWIFSDEPFIKKFYWLSFWKIRASWGTFRTKSFTNLTWHMA